MKRSFKYFGITSDSMSYALIAGLLTIASIATAATVHVYW